MKTFDKIKESKDLAFLVDSYLENYKKQREFRVKEEGQKTEKDIKFDAQIEANELNELFEELDHFNDLRHSSIIDDIETMLLNMIRTSKHDIFDLVCTTTSIIRLLNSVNKHSKIIGIKSQEYDLISEKLSIMD